MCIRDREYCEGGNLSSYLESKPGQRLSPKEAYEIFDQLVNGYKDLHKLKIVHRDIKDANILLKEGKWKISDFGLSRITQENKEVLQSRVGTPLFSPYQILTGQKYTSKCDMWSMGILLYKMLYGDVPFHGNNTIDLAQSVRSCLLYTSPSPRDRQKSRMPSSA
eukprot:TRINITY_DN24106_c0_g1_i1.p1 TRINITY_DN24106_c0_g1~~TRINITY_DN24106_c0_g1_i1.p1  ORF type:complete len:164 (-),score=13.06 TRINITY_DN24106_c0_g1_i1:39-530(-)